MPKEGFEFGQTKTRGPGFYFGKEAVAVIQKAVQELNREHNAARVSRVRKAIEISEMQNRALRKGMGSSFDDIAKKSGQNVVRFVHEADKLASKIDPKRVPGFQQHPVLTQAAGCVDRLPIFDFFWVEILGNGLIEFVSSEPDTIYGVLGGNCAFAL